MVSSKKVHCAYCQKKCSGNVLRYQDQYYHKKCFELEQSESLAHEVTSAASGEHDQLAHHLTATSSGGGGGSRTELHIESGGPSASATEADDGDASHHQTTNRPTDSRSSTSLKQRLLHSSTSQQQQRTTKIFTTHSQGSLQQNNSQNTSQSSNLQTIGRQPNDETNSLGQHSASSSRQNLPATSSASAYQMSSPSTEQAAQMGRSNKSYTMDSRHQQQQQQQQQQRQQPTTKPNSNTSRAATLPHSVLSPSNGFTQQGSPLDANDQRNNKSTKTTCAGCCEKIVEGQALIALDLHWHVWCFKCAQCKAPLHGEYVAKDSKAYCEKDYQKLFGITCVYCKRYITGKVLQAGEVHHFHPSCARCSKCGEPFVPGEEMYLQGEVTWHPRCGPGPNSGVESSLGLEADDRSTTQLRASRAQSPSMSSRSRSRSASPFSYMSRQYGRASPAYADSEAVGDLSRVYTISYLNSDPNQGYLRRPIEPNPPKSPQFSRPTSMSRLGGAAPSDRSRCSSRSQQYVYSSGRDRSVPRGMYSVLSSMRSGSSSRARSPSMMNDEAIQLAAFPSGQKPSPDSVPKIERDDFPAPPFPYPDRHHHQHQQRTGQSAQKQTNGSEEAAADGESPVQPETRRRVENQQQQQQQPQGQERASRPRSREIVVDPERDPGDSSSSELDPQFRKEEEELSKIANGIGKIFLQTLKEREKLRAWKRANLDPRNASRTPSATRELPSRLRYDNPTNASPSRDLDRPRPWEEEELYGTGGEHSPTRTRSSLGRSAAAPGQAHGVGASSSAISSAYGYKVVQSNRSTPRPGYGLTSGPYGTSNGISSSHSAAFIHGNGQTAGPANELSFAEQQRVAQARAADLLGRTPGQSEFAGPTAHKSHQANSTSQNYHTSGGSTRSLASAAHFRRSMPNVANLHHLHPAEGPPKLYPYHLLATSNYRLPPDVDRCHLERHLSNEEFQYIFHCDRLDFYRLPEWKRNELKRRARLF